MKRRLLWSGGLAFVLAACGGNVPGDDVTSSEEGIERAASSAGVSPSDVSALAPRPGLSVTVSPERGELSASLAFPALPSRASSAAEIALSSGSVPADFSAGFGVGFSLSVPSIQMTTDLGVPYRARESDTQDTLARLSLGAERLVWVKTETVSGKRKIEYRLDVAESTVRIYRHMDGGTVSIRGASGALESVAFTGFEVVYPDGRREIYSEEASVAEGVAGSTSFSPTRWPLVLAISPTGDAVSYEYTKAGERSYLRSVRFAGGRSVYTLESVPRSEGRVSHLMGYPQGPGQLYTKLVASFDGEPMYTWCFVHAVAGESGPEIVTHSDCQALASEDFESERQRLSTALSGESKLLGVVRFGRGQGPFDRSTPAEPLIRFRYTAWGADDLSRHELVYDMDVPDVFGFGPSGGSELIDINSDGLTDIVRYSAREGVSVPSYNSGDLSEASLFTPSGTPLTVERTIGGVSRRDVPRFDAAAQATSVFLSGDFDGDGRTGLVQATASGTRTELSHYAGRADRTRPFATAASSTVLDVELARFARGRTEAVDLNADGKADLLTTVAGSTDSTWTAFINVTQPGASALSFVKLQGLTFPFRQGAGTELDNPAYRFLDANGDGLTDFAVIRSSGAGEKGICIYENQGKVNAAYPTGGAPVARLVAGALLFGDPRARDSVCAQGRFVSVSGLSASQNINAMWLMDVNGDRDMDLVNVTAAANELSVRLGRGERGFAAEWRMPLDEGVSVDPENKWNTRVLDIDADGLEEILVYEPNASGGRIKVIDFNRDGVKNLISPDLLAEVEEGPGLKHAVQYATSTDELIRDARRFGRDDARVRALPYPATVVKRHLTAVGDEAPRVREFQYHAPYFNERERGFAGFGQCEELDYGDDSSASVVRRRAYQVASAAAPVRRFFAGKLRTEEVFQPRLTSAQAARIAASAGAWPSGVDGASQTAETWSEEPYAVEALLSVHEETWALAPPAPGPKTPAFLQETIMQDTQCSGAGCPPACAAGSCPEAATMTQTFSYDTTYNRLVRRTQSMSAVAGPNGTELPARSYVTTYAYDAGWEARGVLTAWREISLLSGSSGRVLDRTTYDYGPGLPLPVRTTRPILVDAEALAALPAAVRAPLEAPRTEVRTFRYDVFGNVVEISDALGLVGTNIYDATGVLVVETQNALGHATQYCYGTTGCALTELAPRAEGVVPARSISPTHVRTPQGDVLLTEVDARHRPVRTVRSGGAERRIAYRDARAQTPMLVHITEQRSEAGRTSVERLAAFRADGLVLGEAVAHEAGGARIASFSRYGRRGDLTFRSLPYSSEMSVGQAFDAGRFPSPEGAERGETSVYDGLGRRTSFTDATGLVTRIAIEPWGLQIERDLGAGPGAGRETRREVMRNNEIYAIVDELGNVHRYERDERGFLRTIALAGSGAPRRVTYDSAGSVVMTSLPGGLTRLWIRDGRARVTEQRTWDRAFTASESIATTYDALDRESTVSTSSSSRPDGWDEIALTYDGSGGGEARPELIGHLSEATILDRVGGHRVHEAFGYSRDGRLTSRRVIFEAEDARRQYEQRFTYDSDGTLASYRDPFGSVFTFARTPSGAPSSVVWSAGGGATVPLLADIAYNVRGDLASYRIPQTRLNRQLNYDASSGQLVQLRACVGEASCAGGAIQDVTYDRRADGRIIAAREASDVASYAYSARGELVRAALAGVAYTYGYTPSGQVAVMGEGAEQRSFGAEAESSGLPLPAGSAGEVDAFGRLTAFGSFRNAEYDPLGRLRRVEVDGGAIVYGYEIAGDRVSKRLLRRGGDREVPVSLVVYPTDTTRDDGVERQSVVRLGNHRAALVVNETRVLALVDDQLGAVRRVVDERGDVVLSADTTPFGMLVRDVNDGSSGLASTEMLLGFTGQLRDPDTGLVHMGAREYVSALASFTTPDPYAITQPEFCADRLMECHPYTYVGHDPVNFTDATGLMGNGSSLPTRSHNGPPNSSPHHGQPTHHGQQLYHGMSPNQTHMGGMPQAGWGQGAQRNWAQEARDRGWNSATRYELDQRLASFSQPGNYASAIREVNRFLDPLRAVGVGSEPARLLVDAIQNDPSFQARLGSSVTIVEHVHAQHHEAAIFRQGIQNFDPASQAIANIPAPVRGVLSYVFSQRFDAPNPYNNHPSSHNPFSPH
ncbi:toxin TcdB middle/N-terminal domain-containing protein [Sorangium sp. So ce341]|uniref:toxin TcdB middle/N-terminal domain-containing protein n=1 Tax=Sorangium sp. So ce341 TaxID=3133302 RepID=UPI003F5E45A5